MLKALHLILIRLVVGRKPIIMNTHLLGGIRIPPGESGYYVYRNRIQGLSAPEMASLMNGHMMPGMPKGKQKGHRAKKVK